jgi:hypothetical protein
MVGPVARPLSQQRLELEVGLRFQHRSTLKGVVGANSASQSIEQHDGSRGGQPWRHNRT